MPAPALLLTIATLLIASHASAQARPYHANGTAQFAPNQSDFTGSGNATHLGSYTEVGHVTLTGTSTPNVLAVNGCAVAKPPNGPTAGSSVGRYAGITPRNP